MAWSRTVTGKGPNRRLRTLGRVPAVIYGSGQVPDKMSVDAHFFCNLTAKGTSDNVLFNLLRDGQTDSADTVAVVRELQRDPVTRRFLHIDLHSIRMDVESEFEIPVGHTGTPAGCGRGQNPGGKEFMGRGVAFCPHCDGPFYKGRRVAVVGGGNSGVEAAIDLAGICSHVTLVEYLDVLKADAVLVRNLKSLPNVDIITHARVTEVVGGADGVTALKYQDRKTGEMRDLPIDGVFVQIGLVPNSAVAKNLLELSPTGEIVVDNRCRTSVPGIYAAGDVTTVPFKQIIIAMGEGAKAALTAFEDRIRAEQPA